MDCFLGGWPHTESTISPNEGAGQEKLEMYEAHMAKIKEATGVTDEQVRFALHRLSSWDNLYTVILQIFVVVLFSVFSVVVKKDTQIRKRHRVITTASTDTKIKTKPNARWSLATENL